MQIYCDQKIRQKANLFLLQRGLQLQPVVFEIPISKQTSLE